MHGLFTTLFIFAAIFMLWRTVRPHRNRSHHTDPISPSQQLHAQGSPGKRLYTWPSLGLFQLGTADSSHYQRALKLVTDGTLQVPSARRWWPSYTPGAGIPKSGNLSKSESMVNGWAFCRVAMPAASNAAWPMGTRRTNYFLRCPDHLQRKPL